MLLKKFKLIMQYPATAPQNLAVVSESVGQRELQLQWELPVMPNGIITGYRIYYIGTQAANPNFEEVDNILTSNADQMVRLTALTPDTNYSITVAAINGAGEGDSSTAITQITDTVLSLTTALFQLRILPVGDCATWVEDGPDLKFQEIISAVVNAVSMRCSCTFTKDNIQNNEFSCRSIENAVVFRAEIVYTDFTYTAAELVDFVSQWVQSAPSFVVGPSMSRVNVDTNCPAQLDSFLSEDCVSMDQEKTQSIGAIIGGALAGVGAIFIFTFIIVAVLFIQKRKQKSYSPTAEEIELSQDNVPVDTNPAYESSIRKPAILITSNPAYGHFSSLTQQSASPYEMVLHPEELEGEHEYDVIPYDLPPSTQ